MKTMNTITRIPTSAELAASLRQIGDDLIGIARDLVAAIDTRPETVSELITIGINRELIRRMERIGRGQISQRLVLSNSASTKCLMSLPLSEQEAALDKGVEVLDGDETTLRHIPVHELSTAQVRQVFAGDRIRTVAEQRTFLRERSRSTAAAPELTRDYKVNKDCVAILRPCKVSRSLLAQWLAEMS